MENTKLLQLIDRISTGLATDEEISTYNAWCRSFQGAENTITGFEEIQSKMRSNIDRQIDGTGTITRLFKRWPGIAAAAALIAVLAFSIWFLRSGSFTGNSPLQAVRKNDIKPGSDKAVLTLGNGQQISLTDAESGEIAKESGIAITKTAGGALVYHVAAGSSTTSYNTIATPKGGQYTLVLCDGTKVILNAASSLKYPAKFSSDHRKVSLTGEAYFEVAKDHKRSFIVTTEQQEVTVLGTHFNINAYQDGPDIRTTLLEGAVKVTKLAGNTQVLLKPGQQSVLNHGNIKVDNVDVADAVSWKNGYFQFNGKTLEMAMLEVARWYDVDVEYKNDSLKQQALAGTISKYEQVTNVLKTMELTGAFHFRITGRKIIIE